MAYNREAQREYGRNHYLKHKEQYKEKAHKYYLGHREHITKVMREWHQNHKDKENIKSRQNRLSRRIEVLTHYGKGKCACVRCGESRLACLSIDHINGGGNAHRGTTGSVIYRWLKNNDLPNGYQTLCMNCQFVKRAENNEYSRGRPPATNI